MDKLPGHALVKVYVDGQRLNAVAAQSGSSTSSALGLDNLKYLAAAATAEDDGVASAAFPTAPPSAPATSPRR